MKTLAILGVWLAGLALCLAPPTYGPFPTGTGGGLSSNEVYSIALSVGGPTNGISASTATNIVNNNNAATATTASNVAAAVTNDWRNYTLAASNSLYSTIVTQECVEVFTSDTNRIYATLAGTAAANGTYHWNASLVSYTNTTGCGIYTDDIDFFITNASSLYVGVGNNFDVTWDVDTGGSPPPVTRFGTNSTVYCADIPAAFQSISFNSNALYLSVGGNDLFAVRGNPIRPWKTFSACLTNAVQGDVVFIGPGTFTNLLDVNPGVSASIIGAGKTVTTIHGGTIKMHGSNLVWKDFTYDARSYHTGYVHVASTNVIFENVKILGQQDGLYLSGWDNLKAFNVSIESEWDCIADYQWTTRQSSNSVAQFYSCDLFSRNTGNNFRPTAVSVGSSQLKFFGGSIVASNGASGQTACFYAQSGGSAAAHLGRITIANVSLLAASTNGASYALLWATNGQIFTSGMAVSPGNISGSPTITALDTGADMFPGIIISTNTGSVINSVGITNGNVTIPGTLGVTGATTMGALYGTTISGNGSGITNVPASAITGTYADITTTNLTALSGMVRLVTGSGTGTTNTWRMFSDGDAISMDFIETSAGSPSGYIFDRVFNSDGNFTWAGSIIATNAIVTLDEFHGDGGGISNLNAAYISGDLSVDTLTAITLVVDAIDTPTNSWTINTSFLLGTNATFTSGAATGGIIGVANAPTNTARFGELNIKATGDITFTNPAAFYTSDYVDSRVITNGNTAVVAVSIIPGFSTNLAIVQFK